MVLVTTKTDSMVTTVPNENGFSTIDRRGCKDTDGDGYSNPTDDWTVLDGADFLNKR